MQPVARMHACFVGLVSIMVFLAAVNEWPTAESIVAGALAGNGILGGSEAILLQL